MKAVVLAYHSHNIAGRGYESNDHVAFASDLETLTRAGARIVPAARIAQALGAGEIDGSGETLAALTFDDGPVFDVRDFVHPEFGAQRSFREAMLDFRRRHGERAQPELCATSFVIASPEARHAMETSPECGYTFLDDWLSEAWWGAAAEEGVVAIGNHSWDHVHPAPARIATRGQERGSFARVDNAGDADSEIRAASDYINARVAGRCRLFAFPYGDVNDYLVGDYLPRHRAEHGMEAAFGTGGRAVAPDDSIWNIPRIVCGHHWRDPDGLRAFLG